MMSQFRIYALGEEFDVDAYVASSHLPFEDVWHRGQQLPTTCVEAAYQSSGCGHDLGNGLEIPIPEQEHIAEEFLRKNAEALQMLSATPGVTTLNLGLQYPIDVDGPTIGICMGPSLQLMHAALSARVKLIYYVGFLREKSEEQDFDD